MPVSYRIDPERGMICTRCTGYTTFAEVIEHFDVLRNDPSLPPSPDVYLDLSENLSLPSMEQTHSVAEAAASMTAVVRWGALAIVVSREAAYGTSRMFEAFVEPWFSRVRVFRDAAEAESWLSANR